MQQFHYLLVFVFLGNTLSENCDQYGIRLYEDMACKPINSGSSCPTSYDCNLKSEDSNKCLVRGKTYNRGNRIPRDTLSHTCEFGCICNPPTTNCPQWGCGNWAGVPPVPENCYREYTLEACCSTGMRCPPFNDTTTCAVDGKEYKAGEKFFPKDSCWACICQKGFSGKYEVPFCKRSGCDAQVKNQEEIQKSCAAVYVKRSDDGEKRCCPTKWVCPTGSETITSSGRKSDATCKFGDKTLQIGDYFEVETEVFGRKKLVKCECKIPPLVMCYA